MKKCDICGGEIDFANGSAALMIAFSYDHSTTMTNNAFCADCYRMFVEKPLKLLNEKGCLNIPFEDEQ